MNLSNRSNPYRDKRELPIDQHKRSILYLLDKKRILIIVGETGSGKSTRIPQIIYSAGIYNDTNGNKSKIICITQPRRVAAIQLASRVAQDLNCSLGSTVGYAVRFKDVTDSDRTLIKFMTEGLLVREMMIDPLLMKYSVIIVDEVHERNLNTDLLLGLLKCLMLKRTDLKLMVCSATLNIVELRDFFTYPEPASENLKEPAILCIGSKMHSLKFFYLKEPPPNYMQASIETAISIHERNRLNPGKILIFLTGQDEVEYVCDKLIEYAEMSMPRRDLRKLIVLPLHASLRPEEISKVFERHGSNTRDCIVSTNVAETSLTIEDVAFIVDCGFTKLKICDARTGIDSLSRVPISKSSAKQRAGRAGRTRDGIVYRLYPEAEYAKFEQNTVPEIQRSSLLETILLLKSFGVSSLQRFPLISPLPSNNLVTALQLLEALQAVDERGNLTSKGEIMAYLNLDPRISKVLVSLETLSCTLEACKIAAMLQVKEIYSKPGKRASSLWSNSHLADVCASEGDLPSYLNILNGFITNQKSKKWADKRNLNYQALLNASNIAAKLESQLRRKGVRIASCNGRIETIKKSLVSGLFPSAAYLHPSGDYKTINGDQIVHIHPTSIYSEMIERPKFVVFVEILNTTKPFMRHIMSVEQNWLLDAAPRYYSFS